MLIKPCPRCGAMISYGVQYCATCAPIAMAERKAAQERKAEYKRKQYNKSYNHKRDPKYSAFYRSKDWRMLSRAFMQHAGYKCQAKLEGCQRIAAEVHHIESIQTDVGWTRRLDWDNLEAVCTSCHNRRHKRWTAGNKVKQDGIIDLRTIVKGNTGGGQDSADHFGDNGYRGSSLQQKLPTEFKIGRR